MPAFQGGDNLSFYYLGAALLILGLLVVWRIHTSRLGWVFRSIRQNEDLADSIGINVARYRILAYGVCCAFGGLGGAFFAAFHQNIYPGSYSVTNSVYFMLYCFLGGLDFIFGPVVGAFLLVTSFELLDEFQQYQALVYGLVMISFILWLPNGILSLTFRRAPGSRTRPRCRRSGRAPRRRPPSEPARGRGAEQALRRPARRQRGRLRGGRGEILGVIGPNGAGKSTLFKLITSFLRPTSGRVIFQGEEISRLGRMWSPAAASSAPSRRPRSSRR